MKELLRSICSPILKIFETGDEQYVYKPMSRVILLVISILFGFLTAGIIFLMNSLGAIIPLIIFGTVSLVCLIVATLGTDRAVAKIWGNR